MAWIEPKTDWTPNDYVTVDDMNRIAGNVNHIYQTDKVKTGYTLNDFATQEDWESIIKAVSDLAKGLGLAGRDFEPEEVTAENFNDVEDLTLDIKSRLDLIFKQTVATVYVGDNFYSAEAIENYMRGV